MLSPRFSYVVFLLFVATGGHSEQIERITSILGEPFLMLKRDHTTYLGNEIYEGFTKDLADTLSTRLNFTYKLTLVRDSKYGKLANGIWNGMIGELLQEGIADMSIAPLTITKERRSAVDFSTPFLEFQLSILLRRPGFGIDGTRLLMNETETNTTFVTQSIILRPLTLTVWVILGSILVLLISISFLMELTFVKFVPTMEKQSSSGTSLQYVFWTFIAIVFAAYIGSFVSYKLGEILRNNDDTEATHTIKSISDLASQNTIKFGAIRAGSTFDYFRVSPDRIHRKVYSGMTRDKSVMLPSTIEEGVGRVRYGTTPYAFIMESPYASYQTTLKPCNVVMIPTYFGPKKAFAVATRPDYRLRKQINSAVLAMKENGELEELEAKWMHAKDACGTNAEIITKQKFNATLLDFGNVLQMSSIILVAVVVSAVITIVEVCITRKANRPKINTQLAMSRRSRRLSSQ